MVENVEVSCCKGSRHMPELIARLQTMRSELVETMAGTLATDGNWCAWLPLLAQVEAVLRAVEAVAKEREVEAGGGS